MDNNTEKHVVEMDFENRKFQKNVKESVKSVNELKESLDFSTAAKSITVVEKSFSRLEVIGASVLINLTSRVVDLGVNLVKSLSTDNISSGWDKFGQKTTSVATMLAQTLKVAGKELTNQSEKLEVINKQLDRLNWFSDETSYTFTDMVDSISKFTAAGQDLDVSVKAIEGIATWAALSGQNATVASRAMYQLAQAMGKGYIQLIDWKSIENANMGTIEFKNTVLETAAAMNILTKSGSEYISKTGKKITAANFSESLSDKWFTGDVLTKSLEKYSAAVDKIYDISEKEGITASEVIRRYGDELDEFGLKAFKAAQEARTFTDVINSVKDAVSTGWMNTFEKIFGGYTDSKEIWTDLANELYDVFAEGGNFRNDVLSLWDDLEGRSTLFAHGGKNQGAFWNIYDGVVALVKTVKSAWNDIFPLSTFEDVNAQAKDIARKLLEVTENLQITTARFKEFVTENKLFRGILNEIFGIVKILQVSISGISYVLSPIVQVLRNILGGALSRIIDFISGSNALNKILGVIEKTSYSLGNTVQSVLELVNPDGILDKIASAIYKIVDAIKSLNIIENVKSGFNSLISNLASIASKTNDISDSANNIGVLRNKKGLANPSQFSNTESIANSVDASKTSVIKIAFDKIASVLKTIYNIAKDHIYPAFAKIIKDLWGVIKIIAKQIPVLFGGVISFIKALKPVLQSIVDIASIAVKTILDILSYAASDIPNLINIFVKNVAMLRPIAIALYHVMELIAEAFVRIPTVLNDVSKILTGKGISENIEGFVSKIKNIFGEIHQYLNTDIDYENSPFVKTIKIWRESFGKFSDGLKSLILPILNTIGYLFGLIGDSLKKIGESISNINSIFKKGINAEVATTAALVASAVIVGGLVLVGILNLVWLAKAFTHPMGVLVDTISSLGDAALRLATMRGVSMMINSVGQTMLMIASSFLILNNVNDNGMKHGYIIFGLFIGIISGLIVVISLLGKKINTLNNVAATTSNVMAKTSKGLNIIMKRNGNSLITSISTLIKSFGLAFLLISLALKNISVIDPSMIFAGVGVMLVTFVLMIILINGLMQYSSTIEGTSTRLDEISSIFSSMALFLLSLTISLQLISTIELGELWKAAGVIAALGGGMILLVGLLSIFDRDKVGKKFATVKSETLSNLDKEIAAISGLLLAITLSVAMISKLPVTNAWIAIGMIASITTLLMGLVIAIAFITKPVTKVSKTSKKSSKTIKTANNDIIVAISNMINSFSILLATIAGSMFLISTINKDKVWDSFWVLAAIMGLLAAMVIVLSLAMYGIRKAFKGSLSSSYQLESIGKILKDMSLLVGTIAASIMAMTYADPENLKGALDAMIWILSLLTIFTASLILSTALLSSKGIPSADVLGKVMGLIIAITAMIAVISAAIIGMSFIKWNDLIMPLITISLIFVAIGALIYMIGRTAIKASTMGFVVIDTMNSLFKILIVIMSGLAIIMGAIVAMSFANAGAVLAAGGTFAIVISMLMALMIEMIALSALAANVDNFKSTLIIIVSMLSTLMLVATAMLAVIGSVGNIDIGVIWSIFGGMSVAILSLAVALLMLAKADPESLIGTCLSLAIVIGALVASLFALSMIDIGTMWINLLSLCGSLVLLGLTAQVLSHVAPSILIIAASLLAFGIGLYFASNAIEAMGTNIVDLLMNINENMPLIMGTIETFLTQLLILIENMTPKILHTIGVIIDSLLTFLDENIYEWTTKVIGILTKFIDALTDRVPELIDSVVNFIVAILRSLGNNLYTIVTEAVRFVLKFIKALGEAFRDTSSEMVDTFFEFGVNIMKGLWNGIITALADVLGGISFIGGTIKEWMKNTLEIHSPSRMTYRMGEYLMQGLGNGMEDSLPETKDDVYNTMAGVISAANDAIDTATDDLTITPVVDLSNVEEGASDIASIMGDLGNPDMSVTGRMAMRAAYATRSRNQNGSTGGDINTTNNNSTYNNTFNITTNDPEDFAERVDEHMSRQAARRKLAKGGV